MVSMYRRVMRMIPATGRQSLKKGGKRMQPSPLGATFNARPLISKTGGTVGKIQAKRRMKKKTGGALGQVRERELQQERFMREAGRRKRRTGGMGTKVRPRTTTRRGRTGGGGR